MTVKKKIIAWMAGCFLASAALLTIPVQTARAAEATVSPTVSAEPTTVPVKTIDSLTVTSAPLELPYGSALEVSQVSLAVRYSDGTSEIVNPESTFSMNTKKLGEQTLTFTYGGSSVEYVITIVPRQVTGIAMKDGTSTSMQITWDKLEEAENYEIYTSNKENGKFTFLASTTENQYVFNKLVQGELVYVKIRATGAKYNGADSQVKAIAAKPERVTAVTVTKAESTAVSLKWDAALGATGYAVYYKLSTKNAYTYAGSTASLSYRVTGLTANKEYDFVVRSFAADISNEAANSDVATYGTAPAVPVISELKGGDKRLKVYWKNAKGAEEYRIYISTKMDTDFTLAGTVRATDVRIYPIDNLVQKKTYYVKIEASRVYKGELLTAVSTVLFAATKKADATSTAAKFYNTLAKFKKSKAYKEYKEFRQNVLYKKSFVLPGIKKTNIGGFNSSKMVPQSIAFAGEYLLISAYDLSGEQESVIYIMKKSTRKYITSIVLPHRGHVGGMAYDGKNIWISYGKNVQCLKFSVIDSAAKSGKAYSEVYSFTTQIAVPDTASYVEYYKDRLWVGTYNETAKKYMYGFVIENKTGVPTLKQTNKMLMPNRTQGVGFTSDGEMIISRSCQTKPGKSGFICRLDVYKPTWNLTKKSVKKNSKKKTVQMPPMNEGVVVSGAYTYLVFESPALTECPAPVDRVVAFKTTKLIKQEEK